MRKSSSRRSREQPLLFECSIHTVKSMGKFFYNRATTRICAKKPFITIILVLVNSQLTTLYFISQVEQI